MSQWRSPVAHFSGTEEVVGSNPTCGPAFYARVVERLSCKQEYTRFESVKRPSLVKSGARGSGCRACICHISLFGKTVVS